MERSELERAAAQIDWAHTIDLGQGVITRGRWDTPRIFERLQVAAELKGRTVLDVGCWDGFYSFEAERRGAHRVLATDSFVWQAGHKEGFLLARAALQSQVEACEIDVLELSPGRLGTFDVVLFLGVLYHMKHPLLALERVASVTERLLVVETAVDLLYLPGKPALAFYPGAELGQDATNWFGPTPEAVEAMLRSVGFTQVERVWPPRRHLLLLRFLSLFGAKGRAIFHARK
jgi:tRNA (mo5U34)-methyltransferase